MRGVRHQSAFGRWELVRAAPAPHLRRYVREYVGWWEHTAAPLCRREPPTQTVPVIINFGSPVRIFDPAAPADLDRATAFDSFMTGVYDTFALVGTSGPSGGLQVNFTIPGARLFLHRPLADLTNRAVTLDDALGKDVQSLAGRLRDLDTWEARFDMVEALITRRLVTARVPPAAAMWASQRLIDTAGRLNIRALAHEAGCSPKHLAGQFRGEFGLTPKALARVLRFGRAVERMKQPDAPRLADLALDCGYYDQAHFVRDFRQFAGVTPTELRGHRLPDEGGFTAG